MTISFCDMKDSTRFSEGVTPAALVTVLNRYMTLMSEPVRRSGADKQAPASRA
jgi:class 3 adenylate cyclase